MEHMIHLDPDKEQIVQNMHKEACIFDGIATSYLDKEYIKILNSVGVKSVHYTVSFCSLVHGYFVQDNFVMACQKIGRWYRILEECKDEIALATSIEDMNKIIHNGRIALFFGFQNASPLEENIDYVEIFYRLGVRFIQLSYNALNFVGAGCGERVDPGLSDFGIDVIRKMNRLGIAIDLSHCGDRTTLDAIQYSEKPVLFTHANVRKLADSPRNRTDEQIRLLAEKGGVIGVKHMLGNTTTKLAEETTVADLVDHIDYIVNLVGIDHVAIGMDFSGTTLSLESSNEEIETLRRRFSKAYRGKRVRPAGIETISGLPNLTRELLSRGYSEDHIKKILGENLIRVLKEIFGK